MEEGRLGKTPGIFRRRVINIDEVPSRPKAAASAQKTIPMEKIPVLVVLSSAHKLLYEKYFLPTLPEGAEVVLKDLGANTDDGSFLSPEWQEAMSAKIRHTLGFCEISEEGSLFIVSDVDVQFFPGFDTGKFKDYFDSLGCDLVFQKERMRPGDSEGNCGFYAGRNTAPVRELLSAALRRIESDEIKNEQVVINALLQSTKVKHTLLDGRFYARTHGFPPRRDIWMHHANWTTAIPQKIRQLDHVRRIVGGGAMRLYVESYKEHMDRVMARKPSLMEILFAQYQYVSGLRTRPFLIP